MGRRRKKIGPAAVVPSCGWSATIAAGGGGDCRLLKLEAVARWCTID